MFKKISQEEQLMNYFTKFKPLDLLGFAAVLKVDQNSDFEEFIVSMVEKFSSFDRRHRKQLLRLARDVARANQDLFGDGNKEKLPNS